MAKEIKTIKCPSCGSAKIKELRADYYQCESCGTDFFLDSNDININVNHNYNTPTNFNTPQLKKVSWVIVGVVLAFVIIPMLFRLFFPSRNSSSNAYVQGITKEKKYSWGSANSCLFTDAQGNTYYAVAGRINSSESDAADKNNVYLGLFNVKDSKPKWIKKITSVSENITSEIYLNIFDDNNLYIIVGRNGKEVYRLNAATLAIENMAETYGKNNENLAAGIAKIEFLSKGNGSGFKIINNEGKNFWYMPLINQSYFTQREYQAAQKTVPASAVTKTAYQFSRVTTDYPNEKPKLVKYNYKYAYGYPRDNALFGWEKQLLASGIFIDEEPPYKKVFISDWWREKARVVDFTIMAADRTFFSPQVLDFDFARILIAYKPTPADDDTYICQLLDTQNASIIKSIATNQKYIDEGKLTKDGFLISRSGVTYYDNNGKEINTVKPAYDLKFDEVIN